MKTPHNINYPVQGSAADMLRAQMIELAKSVGGVVMQVHDELLIVKERL